MWKPLHIPQDVRCPSGSLGLGTQGGLAFRALPWGLRSSLVTHHTPPQGSSALPPAGYSWPDHHLGK